MSLFNRITRRIYLALHLPVVHIELPQRRPRKGAPQLAVIGEGPTPLDSPFVLDAVEQIKRLRGRDDIFARYSADGGIIIGPPMSAEAFEKLAEASAPKPCRRPGPAQAGIDRIKARLRRDIEEGRW